MESYRLRPATLRRCSYQTHPRQRSRSVDGRQSLLTDGPLRAGSVFVESFYVHIVGVKRSVYGMSRKAFQQTRGFTAALAESAD